MAEFHQLLLVLTRPGAVLLVANQVAPRTVVVMDNRTEIRGGASHGVLEALARALPIDDAERAHHGPGRPGPDVCRS
jgi:hypothetical protein